MAAVCDYCGNMLTNCDYMTECGHIICGTVCYNKKTAGGSTCPICKKQCKFVLIGEKVPGNGSGFLKPSRNIFQDAENIINFRLLTLTRLVRFLRDKISKQKGILNEAKQELCRVKEYKWEIYHLKKENERLKQENERLKQELESSTCSSTSTGSSKSRVSKRQQQQASQQQQSRAHSSSHRSQSRASSYQQHGNSSSKPYQPQQQQ